MKLGPNYGGLKLKIVYSKIYFETGLNNIYIYIYEMKITILHESPNKSQDKINSYAHSQVGLKLNTKSLSSDFTD